MTLGISNPEQKTETDAGTETEAETETGDGDGDGDRDGSCLVKLHFYEVINHSSVFRKVLSDLQLKAGKEEGNEKKSLHQLRKEREADREERIQVKPFPFLNSVYFGVHRIH